MGLDAEVGRLRDKVYSLDRQLAQIAGIDDWHDITTNFRNGWAGILSVMLTPIPDLAVLYAHLNCAAANTADGTTVYTSLQPAYQPNTTFGWVSVMTDVLRQPGSNGEASGLVVDTSGVVTCQGIATGATWARGVGFYRLSV